MLVMPADHLITRNEAFADAVIQATSLAEQGSLVLFGINPTRPETGFGYMELGDRIDSHANAVRRFVEKPDLTTAIGYLEQGNYVWNSGMFCFKASAIIDAFDLHVPNLLKSANDV